MKSFISEAVQARLIEQNQGSEMVTDPPEIAKTSTIQVEIGCLATKSEDFCRGCARMDEINPICHLGGLIIKGEALTC